MGSFMLRAVIFLVCIDAVISQLAHDYWNTRYSGKPGYIPYTEDETTYGMWSHSRGPYKLDSASYGGNVCGGCACDDQNEVIGSCSGSVSLTNKNFHNITLSTFSSPASVTSIQILSCANFKKMDNRTHMAFDNLVNLQTLIIHETSIKDFPRLENTVLEKLSLVNNGIQFFSANWTAPNFPASLTHVALAYNKISWIPDDAFSRSNIQYLSLSYNQIRFFPTKAVRNMPNLVYLGLDGNQIKTISKANMASIASGSIQHLNLSNNEIYFIEKYALRELESLSILELHRNKIVRIPSDTLHEMLSLLHLDLNNNKIIVLETGAISNLPNVTTIRLHSQQPGLQVIQYDAFRNINTSLQYLWISDNELETFPHQVLAEANYTSMHTIWADHNKISNITYFGREAYKIHMTPYYDHQRGRYIPFSTVRNLNTLHLGQNIISHLSEDDLEQLSVLQHLYMPSNRLTEETISHTVFRPMPVLLTLDLSYNNIQYVPEAVKRKEYLASIRTLNLNNNHMTFLENGDFVQLDTLTSLYLSSNGIIAIEDGAFPNESLATLHLANNELRFLHEHPFTNLSQLVELQLQANDIVIIPDSAFHGLSSLQNLYISNNFIKRIDATCCKDSPLNGNVDFSYNEIAYIEDGTFDHVTSANNMYFNNNKMVRVPNGGDFSDLSISNSFSLANNYIEEISSNSFVNFGTTWMYLDNNRINHIHSNAFRDVSISQTLSLSNNYVRTLHPYAFNGFSARDVAMAGLTVDTIPSFAFTNVSVSNDFSLASSQIKTIEEFAFNRVNVGRNLYLTSNGLNVMGGSLFSSGSRVNQLWMYNNDIYAFPPDVFENVVLRTVNFDNNFLVAYPGEALANQNLQSVSISNNLITDVPLGSFTAANNAMQSLYLSGNQIAVMQTGLFRHLTSLQTINWANNNLREVQPGAFVGLENSLVNLQLSNNQLFYFPALTQLNRLEAISLVNNDIRFIEPFAFNAAPDLESLHLSGNPVECDCYMFATLRNISTVISSGQCGSPARSRNYKLHIQDTAEDIVNFLDGYYDDFQCSARDVSTTAVDNYGITVTWTTPELLFPDNSGNEDNINLNSSLGSHNLTLFLDLYNWTYQVDCFSDVAPSMSTELTAEVADPARLSITFNRTHGVEDGVVYACSVRMELNDSWSAWSYPDFVTTPTALDVSDEAGPDDYVIDIHYYDFSFINPDFNGQADNPSVKHYSNPRYIPSPYGNWLTENNVYLHEDSSLSDWYRDLPGTNIAVHGNVILQWKPEDGVHRLWDSDFYPVDTLGYGHEGQQDCNAKLHNFGFTTVARGGLIYEGTGTISVAGGDQLWLALNKTLLLELTTNHVATSIPCMTIEISPAAEEGGAWLIPCNGTLNTVSERCEMDQALEDQKVWLQLEIGDTYYFEVFHVERFLCKSSLYIETSDIRFFQNTINSEEPPIDYFVYLNEDFWVDGIVTKLDLANGYSTSISYDVDIIWGNGARHFTVKEDSLINREASIYPGPTNYTYTSLPDVPPFVECDGQELTNSEGNDASIESFSVTSSTGLLTLSSELDFEVKTRYVITMTVVDPVTTATGTITVRVTVFDVNDNCPFFENDTFAFVPLPALQKAPLLTLTTIDADSGRFAEIRFHVADREIYPPLTRYNYSMDLFDDIYPENSTLLVKIVALDGGTDPVRGAVAQVNITLTNTCLLDVLFQEIENEVHINDTTGEVFFRIPKYYIYDFPCDRSAGMEVGFVIDAQISASSQIYRSEPGRGRINETYEQYGGLTGGWVPAVFDQNQFIQVDMEEVYNFRFVLLQGRSDQEMWVEEFRIYYSDDGVVFRLYEDNNGTTNFSGNFDQNTVVSIELNPPLMAQYIRINPIAWHNGIALRTEFIGCTVAERKLYATACQRCETGFFCVGDGIAYPCGWCDRELEGDDVCEKNPSEHSFGAASECTSCPKGWLCHDGQALPCPMYHYAECNETNCYETCLPCEPGHACLGGNKAECPVGTFSNDTQQELCILCPAGFHQNRTGQPACDACPAGYYSSKMKHACSPCPASTYSLSDGSGCQPCGAGECACMMDPYPCFKRNGTRSKTNCINTASDGVSFWCEECPVGFEGDGVTCTDIDECARHSPCYDTCINTVSGFQCQGCPHGYTGYYSDGHSYSGARTFACDEGGQGGAYTVAVTQTCEDVDECAVNNGRCDVNAYCYNSVGSFECGPCKKGYLGDAFYGCYWDNFCETGQHSCDTNAICIYTGPGSYRCECDLGYAGNGKECAKDSDLDGIPDTKLTYCDGFGCKTDTCRSVPNSGQEDNDGDGVGDNCDTDDDNDVIQDLNDNCPYLRNRLQEDSDSDGVGDLCDNCPSIANPEQTDSDDDGLGDECDSDDDNDGVADATDNCPLVANPDQTNSDRDNYGNLCDNCPFLANNNQTDTNQNGFGDMCDPIGVPNVDRDGDGIPDAHDNCVAIPNSQQSDIDDDGLGDRCDSDIDGDGIFNDVDNCVYVSNVDQQDTDSNQIGDVCVDDTDGDGTPDNQDMCIFNPSINRTSLTKYVYVELVPTTTVTEDPTFVVKHQGREVLLTRGTDMPFLLIGEDYYADVDFSGTWYVDTDKGQDYIGFVFGYQSNRKFIIVTLKHQHYNYGGTAYRGGIESLQIKFVDSSTGPGSSMANAIWHSADTTDEVTILYQDPAMYGWRHKEPLRWMVQHRPSLGLLNVRILDSNGTVVVNTGDIYEISVTGGRIGVASFNQTNVIWSNLIARCVERENEAIYFHGEGDFVELATVFDYNLTESFSIEAMVKWNDTMPLTFLPIICTNERELCLYVENGFISVSLGSQNSLGSTILPIDYWCHVMMRYEAGARLLTVYLNGTVNGFEIELHDVEPVGWENITYPQLYLGRTNESFFEGFIDEVRIYSRWIPDSEIDAHMQSTGANWPRYQKYLVGHYAMEGYDKFNPNIVDTSGNSLNGTISGGPIFVKSIVDVTFFKLAYPDS